MTQDSLRGKVALVTGASSGIGRGIAQAFAAAGASVIATGRRKAALRALAEGAHGKIRTIVGDLNDDAFMRRLVAEAGEIDILSANAGTLTYAPILELGRQEVEDMFRVNVLATFYLCQAVGAAMAARGRGHMVIMTSLAAREVFPFGAIYSATKHALTAITQSLRLELKGNGVKVTEVRTGMVATAMRDNLKHPAVLAAIAQRKFDPITPEEVAAAVMYAVTAPANVVADLIEMKPKGS